MSKQNMRYAVPIFENALGSLGESAVAPKASRLDHLLEVADLAASDVRNIEWDLAIG